MARVPVLCLILVALVIGRAADSDAQTSSNRPHAWRIEALGGVQTIAATDLNAQVEYDRIFVDYLRDAPVEQEHDGGLVQLSRGHPFTVRVLRQLDHRWSLGGGFSFLATERRSSVSASYSYTAIDPRAQEYQRQFSQALAVNPLVLTVRDYLTHGLVRYELAAAKRVKSAVSLGIGWLVAECELSRIVTTEGGFYPFGRRTEMTMTGRGGGFAADALASALLGLTSRLDLLVEGGYAWHEVRTVTGDQTTMLRIQDGEAAEVEREQLTERTGRWVSQPATIQTGDGLWHGTIPTIGEEAAPFTLNLSGWQLRVGVSLGF